VNKHFLTNEHYKDTISFARKQMDKSSFASSFHPFMHRKRVLLVSSEG